MATKKPRIMMTCVNELQKAQIEQRASKEERTVSNLLNVAVTNYLNNSNESISDYIEFTLNEFDISKQMINEIISKLKVNCNSYTAEQIKIRLQEVKNEVK